MTLLSIIANASSQIGIPEPTSIIGNSDQNVKSALALVNREGQNLARLRNTWNGGWTVLEREHTFTSVDGQENYPLPSDFKSLIGDTIWNRSDQDFVEGGSSPQEWQNIKSNLVEPFSDIYRVKRATTGAKREFFVEPIPGSDGQTFAFEYLSDAWVSNAAESQFFTSFQADDDFSLIDETLVEMGLIWRFRAAKGLSYAAELTDYEINRDQQFGADAGQRTIRLARARYRFPRTNVPDTGYGL